jgi:hybrid cluster-associated redox disulfide protein
MMKTKNKQKISKKTKLSEIMQIDPELGKILLESGMSCFMCPMAQMETLEEGCLAHGMTKKDIDKLIENLNKKVNKK